MTDPRDTMGSGLWRTRYLRLSAGLSASLVVLGLVGLAGSSMKAITAVLFVVLGVGLWLARSRRGGARMARRLIGLVVVTIAAAGIAQHLSGSGVAERMALASAVSFVLLGTALLLHDGRATQFVSRAAALLAAIIALVAICGYLYAVTALYATGPSSSMALHTALGFLVAASALLLARPDADIVGILASGTSAGRISRRLLPAIVIGPLLIGVLVLRGETSGLYDTRFGLALSTLSTVIVLTAFTSAIAAMLRRSELSRLDAESARQHLFDQMKVARTRLEADFDAMTKLHRVASLYLPSPAALQPALAEIVDVAIALSDADLGNLRILDPRSRELSVAAQRGFPTGWVDAPDGGCGGRGLCGTALESGERVIVDDIERSPLLAGTPAQGLYREAEVRGVQSTPLVTRSGQSVGVLSTYYRTAARPDDRSLRLLDLLARQTADLVERVQAEERLRESEQRFRALIDASAQIVWTADAEGMPKDESPTWGRFTGQTYDQWRAGWFEAIHPDDRDRVARLWRDTVRSPAPIAAEYRIRRADGEWRWTSGRAVPLRDAAGTVIGWVGMNIDITEKKQAEEAARAHAERMRLAQQVARIGTFDYDIQAGVNSWTPELEAMYGLPAGGFARTQRAWEALVHPDDRAEALRRVDQAFETGAPTEGEWRVVWPDGTTHWIAGRFRVFKDAAGEPAHLTGVNIDITERKRVEAELRDLSRDLEKRVERRTRDVALARDRLDGIISLAADAIVSIGEDQRITIFNRGAENVFGWARDEILGRPLDVLIPEVARILEDDQPGRHDVTGRRKDGEEFPAEVAVSRLSTESGSVCTVILRDVSERERWLAEQARAHAERAVLLKEIHHRVKNNLQVISSLFYLQAQRTDQETVRRLLDESRGRIQSIALVHEKLYRSEHLASIDFGDYLRDLTASLTGAIGAQAPRAKVQILAEGVFVDIERAIPCALIVNELVTNALKHAFPGGRDGGIRVAVRAHGPSLELEVSDDGVGFPAGLDFREATSLGMQLVVSLTRQLRGEVELIRDGGTTFRVRFPLAPT